jgi:fructose-1,6-bisphosphatase/inositol monophosphatase family enzyme
MSFDPFMLSSSHRALYEAMNKQALYAVLGGDAGNYVRLAEGAGQVVLEPVGGIHDLAAITPLLMETGCTLTGINPDGSLFTPDIDFGSRRTVLATSSPQLRDEVLALL